MERSPLGAHCPVMVKRGFVAVLWLAAVGSAGKFFGAYAGLPQSIGLGMAVIAAIFVVIDPFHRIWPATGPDATGAAGRGRGRSHSESRLIPDRPVAGLVPEDWCSL